MNACFRATRCCNFRMASAVAVALLAGNHACADEGGISFWLPGQYASFAAVPGTPGWSTALIYYHATADSSASAAFPRGGRIDVGINGRANLSIFGPTYVFDQEILGAHPAVSLLGVWGQSAGSVAATLTGPRSNGISGILSDSVTGVGDVIPQVALAWNRGTSNYMTYLTGDIPAGNYDPKRIVNVGLGHGALDMGAGYTFLNPANGPEFSAVSGLTLNFTNPDTNYRSGVDWHVDWGLSFLTTGHFQAGLAGYFFQQITGDSGSGAQLGDFQSRVAGLGPQFGYFFPVGGRQGYLSLKAYGELAAQNRPAGWNIWLTFALTPPQPS